MSLEEMESKASVPRQIISGYRLLFGGWLGVFFFRPQKSDAARLGEGKILACQNTDLGGYCLGGQNLSISFLVATKLLKKKHQNGIAKRFFKELIFH